jgi:hypothetical protein
MRSGPVQNGLDQSRIWTAFPDMPSRFFDLDRGVPRSGRDLDQIWTKSGPNLESSKNRLDQFWQPPNARKEYVISLFISTLEIFLNWENFLKQLTVYLKPSGPTEYFEIPM